MCVYLWNDVFECKSVGSNKNKNTNNNIWKMKRRLTAKVEICYIQKKQGQEKTLHIET